MCPHEYLCNGIPKQPHPASFLDLHVNHVPNLLIEHVTQQPVCEESPGVTREYLVVSVHTVVYAACTEYEDECYD
jgi:hypothetical protein